MPNASTGMSLILPIADLPLGPFAPAREPAHPTWRLIAPWTDPLADRGAYGAPSLKERIADTAGAAIRFDGQNDDSGGRALVCGEHAWRDYTVSCRLRLDGLQLQDMGTIRRDDGAFLTTAMAGVLCRMQTLRRYYYFCIEGNDRLVLYRRDDDDWHVLNWRRAAFPESPVTLCVTVEGHAIRAGCPELGIEMTAIDRRIPCGKAGFRTLGASRLYDLRVEANPEQTAANDGARRAAQSETKRLGRDIPAAVPVGSWKLNGNILLGCTDFARRGRTDLLWATKDGIEARTWAGELLWRHPERPFRHSHIWNEIGPPQANGARRLYFLVGRREPGEKMAAGGTPAHYPVADAILILDGATGAVLVRTELPLDPASPGALTMWDFSAEVGFGTADGEPDFMIRQWRIWIGNGGVDLWMYDRNGTLLWHKVTETVYGHHNAVHWGDINRDGKPEIIAGGVCLDAQGERLWIYEGKDMVDRLDGAGSHTAHYDAVLCQSPDDWPGTEPVLLYVVGGAGVHIVDARTGATRAVYPIGHAQGGEWCKVRADLPGREVLVHTRWGTYGILALFSARGEKLWSIQPDYVGETCHGVQWLAEGCQHIWVNTSETGMGLYDGYGRLVKPLDALRQVFAGKTRQDVKACSLRRHPGGRHWLALIEADTMHLFRPDDDGAFPVALF